jgi:hypothetical protein
LSWALRSRRQAPSRGAVVPASVANIGPIVERRELVFGACEDGEGGLPTDRTFEMIALEREMDDGIGIKPVFADGSRSPSISGGCRGRSNRSMRRRASQLAGRSGCLAAAIVRPDCSANVTALQRRLLSRRMMAVRKRMFVADWSRRGADTPLTHSHTKSSAGRVENIRWASKGPYPPAPTANDLKN